jgi:hypothetical protein
MMQFAALFNEMTTAGAEVFAKFLNSASSSDATRAGRWLNAATPAQVKEAAAFLNQGNLDGFRELVGIGRGFWGWLFGKRKQTTPAPIPVAAPSHAPTPAPKAAKPVSEPEKIKVSCPKCDHHMKYSPDSAGKKAKCSKCGHVFRLASALDKAAVAVQNPQQPKADGMPLPQPAAVAEWDELVAYLRSGKPADISKIGDAGVIDNVTRYYETVAADPDCPKLTYYLLTASDPAAPAPFLVVTAGEKGEHDRAWNFDYTPLLNRAHPGFTWDNLWRNSAGDISNHSKPGCGLASRAPFDRLAQAIVDRKYALKCVLRPATGGPTKPKGPRWNVQVFGEEVVRPDLACQVCGDNRVAYGFHGSHLICRQCRTIYCRRNCMASIHGQCPRCGEADKIDGVSESDDKTAEGPISATANRSAAIAALARFLEDRSSIKSRMEKLNTASGMEVFVPVAVELTKLIGGDGGFRNKERLREIGEQLNQLGGIELMRVAYGAVRQSTGVYFSQDIWDGIGSWRC